MTQGSRASGPNVGTGVPHSLQLPIRHDWLSQTTEEALEPSLPIIDPHHHLWDLEPDLYLLDEIGMDIGSGHNILATVYVQCGASYRRTGPEALRCIGETEFASGMAAMSASGKRGPTQVAAGIVGYADLLAGASARAVLEAHIAAGNGRFRGIRQIATWHDHPELINVRHPVPRHAMESRNFRQGFAQLAPLGLSFDAWIYQTQILELAALARSYPNTQVIVDHLAGPLRSGPFRGNIDDAFRQWRGALKSLAECPNVAIKLGGLGMRRIGFDYFDLPRPPSSEELAEQWRPYMETCIDAFGVERCMFESNFPVDKVSCSYVVLWNAFKRVTHGLSEQERSFLFAGTAARTYRLELNDQESVAPGH